MATYQIILLLTLLPFVVWFLLMAFSSKFREFWNVKIMGRRIWYASYAYYKGREKIRLINETIYAKTEDGARRITKDRLIMLNAENRVSNTALTRLDLTMDV